MATLSDVVIVNDAANINGGSSQVALGSAIALARAGIRVTVFAATGPATNELLSTPNLRLVMTGQHDILTDPSRLRAATQGIWNFSAARTLSEILDHLDARSSVVHFHGWTKALSSSVIKVATARRFATIITLHEYFTACPLGSLYNHRLGKICTLNPLSIKCIVEDCDPRSYRDKMWRVARQSVQRYIGSVPGGVRHFITLSELSQHVLASSLPDHATLHRIDNPISVESLESVDAGHNNDFAYVGRLSPEKGPVLFAQAALDAEIDPIFVGDGECAGEVLTNHTRAEITGWLGAEGVRSRVERSRVLVFPSLWYEVAPLVVLEAAARGIPAIVPDTSAAREFVVNDVTGVHFAGGNRTSLANALRRFKDPDFASRLGFAAHRRYWESPRNMSLHVSEIRKVYERAIADAA